ncbi:oligosaccharide repeat unit polymerase [Moraxella osloensis]|uniref:Oligosaccharide repeat unit polymerase n=1 Tax=Faucicola osloensis TaxID=34062 RepID=A0A6P1KM99_FAUOS|nr:O-antigen polymerase [Moraxella osloensis]QHG09535.1 oligosaccharide repeat unit polymerase [Moraxella osloensis]
MLILTITILFSLAIFGCLSSKSLISPEFISPCSWGGILLFYQTLPHGLYHLSGKILYIIILWNIFLIFGVYTSRTIVNIKKYSNEQLDTLTGFSRQIYNLYYAIAVIGFLPTVYITYKQIQIIGGDFFYSLRMANTGLVETDISLGIFAYTFTFAYIAYCIELILLRKNSKKRRFIILIIINLLLAFITVSKSAFLFLIIPSIIIYLIKNKRLTPNLKVIKYIFLAFLLMAGIQTLRDNKSINRADSSIVFYTYLLGGVPALDKIVNSDMTSYQTGQNTLVLLNNISQKIGLSKRDEKIYLDDITYEGYIDVPYPTNVYTAIGPIWLDFKYYGIVIFSFIIGYLSGFFYYKALRYSWALIVYAYLFCVLILQFFGEYIFTNLSLLLQLILLSYFAYLFRNKRFVFK